MIKLGEFPEGHPEAKMPYYGDTRYVLSRQRPDINLAKTMYETGIASIQAFALQYYSLYEMRIQEPPNTLIDNDLQKTIDAYNALTSHNNELIIIYWNGKTYDFCWDWDWPKNSIFVFRDSRLAHTFAINFEKEIIEWFKTNYKP